MIGECKIVMAANGIRTHICFVIKGNIGSIITCLLKLRTLYIDSARCYYLENASVLADSSYRYGCFTLSIHINLGRNHQAIY